MVFPCGSCHERHLEGFMTNSMGRRDSIIVSNPLMFLGSLMKAVTPISWMILISINDITTERLEHSQPIWVVFSILQL